MKITKTKLWTLFWGLVLGCLITSCDDGKIDTVISPKSLGEYMNDNPDLKLILHDIPNYRSPIYVCVYDKDEQRVTNTPLGKYDSQQGIPYGEITTVQIPTEPAGSRITFVTNGQEACPATPLGEDVTGSVATQIVISDLSYYSTEDISGPDIYGPSGYLSSSKGGEEWMICGENGDESCEPIAGIGDFGTGFGPMDTPAGETTINARSILLSSLGTINEWENLTLCWDPDLMGPEPSIYINQLPIPYGGKPSFAPITEGIFHLHEGLIDCAATDFRDGIASVELPYDSTFGPAGSKVAYPADSSGGVLIQGVMADGIPVEAKPRIIPLLSWE